MIDLEKLRALWQQGLPVKEIAAALGCSDSCASKHAMRLGFPRRRPGSYKIPALRCEALYKGGVGTPQIAKMFGVSRGAVIRLLRSRKIHVSWRRIQDDPRTFVCTAMRRRGYRIKDIAEHVGLSYRVVAERVRRILGPGKHGGKR